jgi:hypothetical protein
MTTATETLSDLRPSAAEKRLAPPATDLATSPQRKKPRTDAVSDCTFSTSADAARSHLSHVYTPSASATEQNVDQSMRPEPGITVLSVDDDPVSQVRCIRPQHPCDFVQPSHAPQLVLQNILKKSRYNIVQAMSGADALAYLRTCPLPDIIFLDLHLVFIFHVFVFFFFV